MKLSSLRHTIRGRLLLLAVGLELLMLSILVANSLRLLHGAMSTQARMQAEQIHPVLKAALTAPMAQRDYATVRAVINESRSAGGMDYIAVVDTSGNRIAANGWPEERPLPAQSIGFPLFERGDQARYDVVVPLSYFSQPLGALHFGLNLTQILVARRTLLIQGASIAAIELVLSTIILFFLSYWITRHLTALTAASIQVASGNFPPLPVPEGGDDVGRLGAAFNIMSRVIADRVRDLTAAKDVAEASERAKSESEERLKMVLDGSKDGFWDWDILHGRVDFSSRWLEMLGYAADDLEPTVIDWKSLVHGDDLPSVIRLLTEHLKGRTPFYELEYRLRMKGGGWKWVLNRGKVVRRDPDGKPLRAAGTHTDITDRKQAEVALYERTEILNQEVVQRRMGQELLQQQQQQLELLNTKLEERVADEVKKNRGKEQALMQSEKMASIGQLAAGVAHEINNPMGFISCNLRTLAEYFDQLIQFDKVLQENGRDGLPLEALELIERSRLSLEIDEIFADGAELIDESLDGAKRVAKIVQDLKSFSRMDTLESGPVSLDRCLESALTICINELKYVATIRKEYEPLPEVLCHSGQLNQVFLNLLINAGQAIVPPGEIVLKCWHEASFVYASVSDTGQGIPEAIRDRIFEPFFTTKDVGKGTGLGLSISYEIIKKHGGEIMVESVVGSGTTFTVKLPSAMADSSH